MIEPPKMYDPLDVCRWCGLLIRHGDAAPAGRCERRKEPDLGHEGGGVVVVVAAPEPADGAALTIDRPPSAEPFDPYADLTLEGCERAYVEAMRAAAKPGFVAALAEQIDAFAAAVRKHYEAHGEEGDEDEPLGLRCVDNASVWLGYAVRAAVHEAYLRARGEAR